MLLWFGFRWALVLSFGGRFSGCFAIRWGGVGLILAFACCFGW